MNNQVTDPLLAVFAEILQMAPESLSDDTAPGNNARWDSLAAMNLVSAIEERFEVQLSTREIMTMSSIGLARTILRGKNVGV